MLLNLDKAKKTLVVSSGFTGMAGLLTHLEVLPRLKSRTEYAYGAGMTFKSFTSVEEALFYLTPVFFILWFFAYFFWNKASKF